MVGKTFSFMEMCIKVIKVEGYFVTVQWQSEGIKSDGENYPSMNIFNWSKEWKFVTSE